MKYTKNKIIEITKAYASLVEMMNMLNQFEESKIVPYKEEVIKVQEATFKVRQSYFNAVPEEIRNVLPVKMVDLETKIDRLSRLVFRPRIIQI